MPDKALQPTVLLNGHAWPWVEGLTLAALIAQQDEAPDAVATALNGSFVARTQRSTAVLRPGDQITVFKAIVGG